MGENWSRSNSWRISHYRRPPFGRLNEIRFLTTSAPFNPFSAGSAKSESHPWMYVPHYRCCGPTQRGWPCRTIIILCFYASLCHSMKMYCGLWCSRNALDLWLNFPFPPCEHTRAREVQAHSKHDLHYTYAWSKFSMFMLGLIKMSSIYDLA